MLTVQWIHGIPLGCRTNYKKVEVYVLKFILKSFRSQYQMMNNDIIAEMMPKGFAPKFDDAHSYIIVHRSCKMI